MTPPSIIDTSRKWQVLIAVAMGVLLGTIDGSILQVALPTLVRALGTTFPVLQWAVLGYSLMLVSLSLLIGRLGDLIGRKRIFTAGFIVFTAASVACGLAPSVGWLIGFRMVQAVGAAMILSLGIAILTEAFPSDERGKALGFIGTTVSLGIISGPVVGGLLISSLSWRWIFFVNLPLGIIGTLTALRLVPESRPPVRRRFDLAGAGLIFLSLGCLCLALTLGQQLGFASPEILMLFGLAALMGASFVAVELRTPSPMIDLHLLANPQMAVSIVTGFLSFLAVGLFVVLPFYLEGVLGLDTRTSGLLLAVGPVAIGLAAPVSGWLSDRLGVRPLTLTGMAVLLVGYLNGRRLGLDTSPVAYALTFLPVGLGMGIFQSPNNSAIMGSVPKEHVGLAGGLSSMTRILGQLTGVALLGSLWAARVAARSGVIGNPSAAPPDAQLGGIHDILLLNALLMAVGVAITVWGLRHERADRRLRPSDRSPSSRH